MLVIRPHTPGKPLTLDIDARTLCGDTVSVRVSHSGYSLSYTPVGSAHWRDFPMSEAAQDALAGVRPGAFILLALQDDRPVGIAVAAFSRTNWCEVLDLRVDTSCRLQGIGRMLLDACVRAAERENMAGLRMTVSDGNPAMCQFAEHCGFRLEGIDRLYFAMSPEEKLKPLMRRACALFFYLQKEKH